MSGWRSGLGFGTRICADRDAVKGLITQIWGRKQRFRNGEGFGRENRVLLAICRLGREAPTNHSVEVVLLWIYRVSGIKNSLPSSKTWSVAEEP